MPFIFNAWRKDHQGVRQRCFSTLLRPITRLLLAAGFPNVDYAYVHGPVGRVHVGARCSTMNTFFNVVSGDITIGDDTLFSHNCQVLTGIHRFSNGRRVALDAGSLEQEVPTSGRDITIGRGCFIGAGAIILGGVTLGDNVIVGAGAVVTKNVPAGHLATGVPATAHPIAAPQRASVSPPYL